MLAPKLAAFVTWNFHPLVLTTKISISKLVSVLSMLLGTPLALLGPLRSKKRFQSPTVANWLAEAAISPPRAPLQTFFYKFICTRHASKLARVVSNFNERTSSRESQLIWPHAARIFLRRLRCGLLTKEFVRSACAQTGLSTSIWFCASLEQAVVKYYVVRDGIWICLSNLSQSGTAQRQVLGAQRALKAIAIFCCISCGIFSLFTSLQLWKKPQRKALVPPLN